MPHLAARRALIAALLAGVACGAAHAALYKWVDEKGVTHYTQEPPPDGKATRIEPKVGAPTAKPETTDTWREREVEFRRRLLEKERAEESAKAGAERAQEQRRARCLEAQEELHVMSPGHPVYRINEKGERVYLEDAEREAAAKHWRGEVEKWCGS